MERSSFIVKSVSNESEWEIAKAIREKVFIEEQRCPPEMEWDEFDENSRHLLGLSEGRAVATARWRVIPYGGRLAAKLERFAVLPEARGHGYGRTLVREVIEDARRAGFDTFVLHAQVHLEEFYRSLGFASVDENQFWEAGIPHLLMVRIEAVINPSCS